MSGIVAPITGIPGIRAVQVASPRILFKASSVLPDMLPQGKLIDGTKAADPLNGTNTDVLETGVLMGKISATGLYGASVLGVTTVANAIGDAIVTCSVATATELVRRIGTSGTFTLTGPAVASGIVISATVTYSAVNLTTGVITCTALLNAFIAGSFIQPTDGSQTPITLIPDGYGIKVSDVNGVRQTVQFPIVPIGGLLLTSSIINYPTDPSLINWLKVRLNSQNNGGFSFDDGY